MILYRYREAKIAKVFHKKFKKDEKSFVNNYVFNISGWGILGHRILTSALCPILSIVRFAARFAPMGVFVIPSISTPTNGEQNYFHSTGFRLFI